MTDDSSLAAQQAHGSYIAQAAHGGIATLQVYPPPTPLQEQDRVCVLKRLRYYYGEQWEQSLQGASLIALGLVKKPDAVQHHAGWLFFVSAQQPERPLPAGTSIAQAYEEAGHELLILGEPGAGKSTLLLDLAQHLVDHPERPLPAGTSIAQAYEEAGHELLILGEPGAGKSTLLLDLAQHLVDHAEQNGRQPLPVIVPLSSWAEKQPLFQDWLAEQVALLYDIPRRLSRSWVEQNQFLPLLDGLDEVPQSARVACIEAIIAYRKEHLVPLVVCSRRAEYEEIARKQRLTLHSAVVIQPLTSQQVDAYLIQAGKPLAAVQTILQTNRVLRDLTTTPLMLSILTLTYVNTPEQDLPHKGSAEEQQRIVFATYIERMVERKGDSVRYSLEHTRTWLVWLAQQMQKRNQSVFYLERLSPDCLIMEKDLQSYMWLGVRFPSIVIGILVHLIVYAFFSSGPPSSDVFALSATMGGTIGGILSWIQIPSLTATYSSRSYKQLKMYPLKHGFQVAGVIGLFVLLGPLIQRTSGGLFLALSEVLLFVLLEGLSCTLTSLLLEQSSVMIEPTEIFVWSWKDFWHSLTKRKRLRDALIIVLIIPLIYLISTLTEIGQNGLDCWLLNGFSNGLSLGLLDGLSIAGCYWLLAGLLQGASSDSFQEQQRVIPNQGILHSAHNGLILGLFSGGIGGLVSGINALFRVLLSDALGSMLSFSLTSEGIDRLSEGLNLGLNLGLSVASNVGLGVGPIVGPAIGLVVALLMGGLAWWRHWVLRFLLWRRGIMPWHYVRFLDEEVQRILLRKVGGGYRFIHDLFCDYLVHSQER